MIGGKVIGVSVRGSEALINVRDDRGDECAVRCEVSPDGPHPRPGDGVWWQCGKVYWTPYPKGIAVCRYADCDDEVPWQQDIPLRKIGYSH